MLVFLPVENRMKTSGVHLGTGRALDVGLTRINLGIALATGRYDDHVAQIEADLRDVQGRPACTTPDIRGSLNHARTPHQHPQPHPRPASLD